MPQQGNMFTLHGLFLLESLLLSALGTFLRFAFGLFFEPAFAALEIRHPSSFSFSLRVSNPVQYHSPVFRKRIVASTGQGRKGDLQGLDPDPAQFLEMVIVHLRQPPEARSRPGPRSERLSPAFRT
jgi:hypothetical protein